MNKRLDSILWLMRFCASVTAVAWVYTSHKDDCLNVGPCKGDVDFWIWLGDVAFYSFTGTWITLLMLTCFVSKNAITKRGQVITWSVAFLIPIASLVAAFYVIDYGVVGAKV